MVVELKKRLTLDLILQAVDRLKMTDAVYIAFPESNPAWRRRRRRVRDLARRLGIGLMTVSPRRVEVRVDPAPYRPRGNPRRRGRLLLEFEQRVGDANVGGTTRVPRVTAYRQDALRCATSLVASSPLSVATMRAASGVAKAASICQRNVYGWFERVERGSYALSPTGRRALKIYAGVIAELPGPSDGSDARGAAAPSSGRSFPRSGAGRIPGPTGSGGRSMPSTRRRHGEDEHGPLPRAESGREHAPRSAHSITKSTPFVTAARRGTWL